MCNKNGSAVLLFILNILHVIFGVAITGAAIWFFIEVYFITRLRNANHYLLDYKVYWPQAIPWVFIFIGVFVICVSCCGFAGAKQKSGSLVGMYIVFEVIAIVALVAAAGVALSFADSESTDKFITDAIWDVFNTMRDDKMVEAAFGDMERRMQCCGANSARDYINRRDGHDFPQSCCDNNYHGWIGSYPIDCAVTNKVANERHGCTTVAINYSRIIIRILSGACVFTAFIGLMNVIVAATLSMSIKRRLRPMPVHIESDSEKNLLKIKH